MRGIEKLHYLIHSLTKSEKRYITLQLSKEKSKKGKTDLKLFERLKSQPELDEDAISGVSEFSNRNQLILRSQYLFDHILRCLIDYNHTREPEIAIGNHIHIIKVLIHKGLYEYTHFHINRAQKLAEKYEDLLRLGILCDLRKRIAGRSSASQSEFLEEMTQIDELENLVHDKISNLNDYNKMYSRLMVALKKNKGTSTDDETTRLLNDLKNTSLFKSEKNALTRRARIIYHDVNALISNHLEHDNETALLHTEKQMQLVHSIVAFNKTNSPAFINCLKNYCVYSSKIGDFDKTEEGIRQLENLYKQRSLTKNIFEQSTAFLALLETSTRYALAGSHAALTRLAAEKITKEAETFEQFFDGESRMILHYYLSIRFFLSKNYREAFSWLEKIVKGKRHELRSDLLQDAQILSLICIYEIDSVNLFQSRQRSYLRTLHSHSRDRSAVSKIIHQIAVVYEFKNNQEQTRKSKAILKKLIQSELEDFRIGPVLGQTVMGWAEKN